MSGGTSCKSGRVDRQIPGQKLARPSPQPALQPSLLLPGKIVIIYNMQVNLLRKELPDGARIGTVDKFQGQEAPAVIVSLATSSGEDLPRGVEFLLNRNRLNVAISRAQSLAVIVASPRLMQISCSTVEQMELVNLLCHAKSYSDGLGGK